MRNARSEDALRDNLRQVEDLLDRQEVLAEIAHRQEVPNRELLESLQRRQNVAELHRRLAALHPADLAYILEALPPERRLVVWREVPHARAGGVLAELTEPVRAALVAETPRADLVAILTATDTDDLASVAEEVPADVMEEVYRSLDAGGRSWVESSITWPEGTVGTLMGAEPLLVREGWTVAQCLEEVRRRGALPHKADVLFVVDARGVLRGVLAVEDLLLRTPDTPVRDAMHPEPVAFTPDDPAAQAAAAFERYGLVSAPVVDDRGKPLGRLAVDTVMDFLRRRAELQALQRAGLSGEEDLFAPAWLSARNRSTWLAVNLVTAFLASRVIGAFESTIAQLVALAALMPIVASVGGNTGNQTVALVIRALALGQITPDSVRRVAAKELAVAAMNGVAWGALMGLFAFALYGRPALGVVMMAAIILNLLVAAVVGTLVPLLLQRSGRDPAQGASVLLTFTTDGMGFFIFLGLARAFLVP
jgi:magnesium transporter